VSALLVGFRPPSARPSKLSSVPAGESAFSWLLDVGGWPVSTLEDEGIDREPIDALIADIEAGQYGLVDHFLLIRHGRIVVDRHFEHDYVEIAAEYDPADHQYDYDHPDWHPYYRGTKLHTLQSVTKSITSVVLGIAIDEGHIPRGVETPAMSFFGDYDFDLSDPRKQAMTLEDMLTMQSGLDWNEMVSYDDEENSCIQPEESDAWIQFVLDHPMREDPGSRFDYNSGISVLLGKIVGVATGLRVDRYADEKLFKPLGIESYYWKISPDGEADTEGGLYLDPHDLARIAYLFLRDGEWNGKRIVSQAWVEASLKPHVPDIRPDDGYPGQGYGYQWWIPKHEDGRAVLYQGSGYGGQLPIVIPHLDLVIVFNAWNIHQPPAKSTEVAVRDIIVPAVRDELPDSSVERRGGNRLSESRELHGGHRSPGGGHGASTARPPLRWPWRYRHSKRRVQGGLRSCATGGRPRAVTSRPAAQAGWRRRERNRSGSPDGWLSRRFDSPGTTATPICALLWLGLRTAAGRQVP